MTIKNYILKSFLHFKFKHLAVIIGVIISTAVITGSLIVGDSVKYSLKNIVNHRLGKTEYSLSTGEKFVRSQLAKEISQTLNIKASSLIIANGVIKNPENNSLLNKIQILGIDSAFWNLSDIEMPEISDEDVFISENTANKLKLSIDDEIIIKFEKLSVIPLNSPYNTNDAPYISLRLKVKQIMSNENLGNFNLKKNQVAPYNVFISRSLLSEKLDLNDLANLILVSSNSQQIINSELLNSTFSDVWQSKDVGLKLKEVGNDFEISSSNIFINKNISDIIQSKFSNCKPILSYLVNSLEISEKSTPYSFVSAVSDDFINSKINFGEIAINEWLAEDLVAKIGDTINLKYYVIDSLQMLKNDSSTFIVSKIISNSDSIVNKSLMPDFPGIGNAVSCVEWNSNMPIDMKKIRDKDEDYWKQFRGTPKAIISLNDGMKLWENKFGCFTAMRIAKSEFATNKPEKEIINCFIPEDLNLRFVNIREEGTLASQSGVDFGELFISLSFFVILSGLLLTVLLFSLNVESRKTEFGILAQLGFSKNQIFKMILFENLLSIILGTIIGVFVGITFNYLIIYAINSVWNDIVRTNMISILIDSKTLLISGFSSFIVSFLTIYLFSRFKLKKSLNLLLSKTNQQIFSVNKKRNLLYFILSFFLTGLAIFITAYSLSNSENMNPSLYLISGALFLFGCVSFVVIYLNKYSSKQSKFSRLNHLAILNTRRNLSRNMSIIIMLSLGIFIVVITGANRKTFVGDNEINSSGTGGYKLWIETSVPIPITGDSTEIYKTFGIQNQKNIEISQVFSKDGDDASCLNLNKIINPKILGVSNENLDKRKSFSFDNLSELIDKENPWQSLNQSLGKNIIPAFADQTVIDWGIMRKIGDTLVYKNELGENLYLVICGGLSSSIFQGNILISEKHFKDNFPSSGSPKLFLADIPNKSIDSVSTILNNQLQDYGINIENTSDKLAQFNSVTNTYLSVFMILGALGVIIGTVGAGIIFYRNYNERKNEFALLISMGFTKKNLLRLLLKENTVIVFASLLIGLISSVFAILPSLISKSFDIPFSYLIILILSILINCLFWIYIPIRSVLRQSLIDSLRKE